MKKLIFGFIVAFAVIGAAVMLSTPTTKAGVSAQIDPSQMMRNAKELPAAHYADYSFVFN